MTSFRAGWYQIHLDHRTRRSRCRLFKTTSIYTAECVVESNGQQFLGWSDPQGPSGPGRPGQWSAGFKALADADASDWWDNPPGGASYKPQAAGNHSRTARTPTARELAHRAACVNPSAADGLTCTKDIHVSLFFDGTNNNMERDRPDKGHSNIVSLFDAHKDDKTETFAYYIPGVGTPFREIGEMGESAHGKTFSAGGEARIHFAMLQVYNAVCRASTAADLLQPAEMKSIVTGTGGDGLATWWRLGDSKMDAIFARIEQRLVKAIEGRRPKVTKVNLSVFGFSRGSAEARVFVKWFQQASQQQVGGAVLEMRFLGIYDTVASVLLADSSPVGSGFFDWADGNIDIAGVQRAVHFVAAHEIRRSFPLSTARAGKTYPTGTKEFVYPGSHSDVGGGYNPGSQGKATAGRTALLSQIPLNDMYFEALNAGVKVFPQNQLPAAVRADFNIDPTLDRAFSAYAGWTTYQEKEDVASASGAPENRMQYHTHLYWRWRGRVSPDSSFKSMASYSTSKPQDQVDLWESELDWRSDVARARQNSLPTKRKVPNRGGSYTVEDPPTATHVERQILLEVAAAAGVPDNVHEFFDKFVHDSHAGFWLLGPQTQFDKNVYIKEIKDKRAVHDEYVARANATQNPGRRNNFLNAARAYELNKFEQRVMQTDAAVPGSMPIMTDEDAADMRDQAGTTKTAVLSLMGTATRREPHGHGRYRRVFDQS